MAKFSWLSPKLFAPLVSGFLVTSVTIGCKELGLFERPELVAYDQATRWRAPESPDPRLLVVAITNSDISRYKNPIIPDEVLDQVVKKLIDRKAFMVGLDLVKEFAQGNLLQTLQTEDRIVPICSHGGKKGAVLKSPPGVPPEKISFADIPVDVDNITRRASLLASVADPQSGCQAVKSLPLQLAESYLASVHQMEPSFDEKAGMYQLGKLMVPSLHANDGGYSKADVYGYPILIKYRNPQKVAPIVSLSDVIDNKVDPSLIENRVVLIGSIDVVEKKDDFLTPYSAGRAEDDVMKGVIVHAQITSQIISAALDNRSLFRFWPEWLEGLVLLGWSVGGAYIAWYLQHPGKLALAIGGVGVAVVGTFGVLFINSLWVPVVSPLIALVVSALSAAAWRTYQTNQEQQKMLILARNQERTIDALKQLLTQQPATMSGMGVPTGTAANSVAQQATTVPFSMIIDQLLGDRYQTIGTLGAGGFATTYLAEDTKRPSRPRCAIKHLMPARRDAAFVEMSRRLFNTEAKILDQLGTHAQIPQLLAYFEQDQEFYLVQELIVGKALNEELAQRLEPWNQQQVLDLLRQMLTVLEFIHSQHVIHRDIKPSNIIRSQDDQRLVLIDFGAVKEINPQLSAEANSTIAIGTRGYTPAEQYAGRPTFSSDIYALGMIAIETATNTSPRDLDMDERTGNLLWRHLAPLTEDLMQIIDRMVAYQYINRYQSAAEILKDLEPIMQVYSSPERLADI